MVALNDLPKVAVWILAIISAGMSAEGFSVAKPCMWPSTSSGAFSSALSRLPPSIRKMSNSAGAPGSQPDNQDPKIEPSTPLSPSSKQKESKNVASEEGTSEGGMWKAALLAGPLFLKFVVILVIKFLTDLVVYPLLWLYRLARFAKNSIHKMFTSKSDEPTNGAHSA